MSIIYLRTRRHDWFDSTLHPPPNRQSFKAYCAVRVSMQSHSARRYISDFTWYCRVNIWTRSMHAPFACNGIRWYDYLPKATNNIIVRWAAYCYVATLIHARPGILLLHVPNTDRCFSPIPCWGGYNSTNIINKRGIMQKKEKRTALVDILVTTRVVNYAGSATRINRHGCPRLLYMTSCFTQWILYDRVQRNVQALYQ